ncbi:16S rRNA (cytosine(1402)-N(4))-methyltransferase RsmH, partial [bacterium]|nr:16S rRNA (cytosine(1402)-N(4))-methyltransferase RsmH [bacterium]
MENKPKIPHIPVMLAEVTEHMSPNRHGIVFVDCTLGYGGHSVAIAETFDKSDTLIGMDRDVEAIQFCEKLFQEASFHFSAVHQGFEELELFMEENAIEGADYFLFDLGFSSPQVDRGERGFSFMREGPLDMRMDRRQPQSAKDILATWSEDRLARIFKIYGDERFSRRIAKAIARRRDEEPIETTQELADIILNAIPAKYQHQEGIHPATRVFQALRIAVNDELEALKKGLDAALNYLN